MPIGGTSKASGRLVLETEQGDRVTIDANSGQDNQALITLENAGATTTEYRAWDALSGQR